MYAPNNARERVVFFNFLRSYVEVDRVVVLMGDFNCVCDEHDRTAPTTYSESSTSVLKEIIDSCGLEDVGALCASRNTLRYTHFQNTSHARLDRIYISVEALRHAHCYRVQPISFTDHCLVSVRIGRKGGKPSKFS